MYRNSKCYIQTEHSCVPTTILYQTASIVPQFVIQNHITYMCIQNINTAFADYMRLLRQCCQLNGFCHLYGVITTFLKNNIKSIIFNPDFDSARLNCHVANFLLRIERYKNLAKSLDLIFMLFRCFHIFDVRQHYMYIVTRRYIYIYKPI